MFESSIPSNTWAEPHTKSTSRFFDTENSQKPKLPPSDPQSPSLKTPVHTPKDHTKIATEAVNNLLPSAHVLPYTWTIYYHSRKGRTEVSTENPEQTTFVDLFLLTTQELAFPEVYTKDAFNGLQKTTISIASVEQLWEALSLLKHANELGVGLEIFVFKAGIEPIWEDKANAKGGRWIFKFLRRLYGYPADEEAAKHRTLLVWERLVLRVLGGLFLPDDHICNELFLNDISGLVLSVRRDEDVISVWNTNLSFDRRYQEQYFKSVRKTWPDADNPLDNSPEPDLLLFNDRRLLCSLVLKVIREADEVLKGASFDVCGDLASTERVPGLSFEYRLNAEWDKHDNHHHHHHHRNGTYRGRRYKHKEEEAGAKLFEPGNFLTLGRSRRRKQEGEEDGQPKGLMALSLRRRMQMREVKEL